jgi:hypothetical protein
MLHAVFEVSSINRAIFPNILTEAIAPTFEILAVICIAISKFLLALAVLQKVLELTLVDHSYVTDTRVPWCM